MNARYVLGHDVSGTLWIWREDGDDPVPIISHLQLANDPLLWRALVAVTKATP